MAAAVAAAAAAVAAEVAEVEVEAASFQDLVIAFLGCGLWCGRQPATTVVFGTLNHVGGEGASLRLLHRSDRCRARERNNCGLRWNRKSGASSVLDS